MFTTAVSYTETTSPRMPLHKRRHRCRARLATRQGF